MAAARYRDVENQIKDGARSGLHGISPEQVRLGLIRKVYGIVCVQMCFTVAVVALATVGPLKGPLLSFVLTRPSLFQWGTFIASFASLIMLSMFKRSYPANLYLLGVFTAVLSLDVAVICAMVNAAGLGELIVQAGLITTLITGGLTLYAFRSKRDFSFLGALLFPMLFGLTCFGFLSAIFPSLRMGVAGMMYSAGGALIFCGYIVFDTWRILHQIQPDDYVEAAIQLYLDIVNLFLHILEILLKLAKNNSRNN